MGEHRKNSGGCGSKRLFQLLRVPDYPSPCKDREGVEQPIRKARHFARQHDDTHSGDDCASAELQCSAKAAKNFSRSITLSVKIAAARERQPQPDRIEAQQRDALRHRG